MRESSRRVLPPLTSTPRRSPCAQNLPVCSPGVKRGSSTCAADGASAAIGRRRCGVCLWRSCASGASGAQLAEGGTADSELLCDRGRGVSGDVYPWPQGCRSSGAMCSAQQSDAERCAQLGRSRSRSSRGRKAGQSVTSQRIRLVRQDNEASRGLTTRLQLVNWAASAGC